MGTFSTVCSRVLDDATQICLMEYTRIHGYSYVDRLFNIKNTHYHHAAPSGLFVRVSRERYAAPTMIGNSSFVPSDEDGELLIRIKDRNLFLEKAKDAKRVKMPSSILHRLGGGDFMADMNALGFHTVLGEYGSLIDSDGMIHWEK